MAITLDPSFLSKLGSLVIMGGSLASQGNSNRAAEFNFHSDPEAAHIVLNASLKLNRDKPVIQLVPWETCLDHKLPWSFYDEIARAGTTLSKILRGITLLTESMLRDKIQPPESDHVLDAYLYSLHQFLFPDIYATLVLLDEEAILKHHDWDIAIELEGKHSRGGCFVEWLPIGPIKVRNARVVSSLSTARLEEVLRQTFLGSK
jgi:purine nucleosidase